MREVLRVRLVLLILLAVVFGLAQHGTANAKDTSSADRLLAKADAIATKVAKLRGLKLKDKIERGVMSKPQIKARILAILDQEYTPAELDAEALVMKRFGLIPTDVDYVKIIVSMLEDQIAGFYDQHEKKLYIAGWAPMGGEMLMAHEIDHALQDQHFDLVQFMKTNKENGDSQAARQALVEGDGMALMLEYEMAEAKQAPPWGNDTIVSVIQAGIASGMGSVSGVPLALQESLTFPYSAGLEFVAHFRKHHPWKRINEIYKKPPLSTEHILHPESYLAYELPVLVNAATPTALRGYVERKTHVHGEKGLELFLRSHGVKAGRAMTAAAGWGGDLAAVYAPKSHKGSSPKGTIGVSFTTWDELADAQEFFEALQLSLPSLSLGGKEIKRKDKVLEASMVGGGRVQVERRGQDVLLMIDVPEAMAEAARADLWKSWSTSVQK